MKYVIRSKILDYINHFLFFQKIHIHDIVAFRLKCLLFHLGRAHLISALSTQIFGQILPYESGSTDN